MDKVICEYAHQCDNTRCYHHTPHHQRDHEGCAYDNCMFKGISVQCVSIKPTTDKEEDMNSTNYPHPPWYGETQPDLDLTKPIMNKVDSGEYELLIPQMAKDTTYDIIGYNWFLLTTGKYNSAVFYNTVQEAIRSRGTKDCFNHTFEFDT